MLHDRHHRDGVDPARLRVGERVLEADPELGRAGADQRVGRGVVVGHELDVQPGLVEPPLLLGDEQPGVVGVGGPVQRDADRGAFRGRRGRFSGRRAARAAAARGEQERDDQERVRNGWARRPRVLPTPVRTGSGDNGRRPVLPPSQPRREAPVGSSDDIPHQRHHHPTARTDPALDHRGGVVLAPLPGRRRAPLSASRAVDETRRVRPYRHTTSRSPPSSRARRPARLLARRRRLARRCRGSATGATRPRRDDGRVRDRRRPQTRLRACGGRCTTWAAVGSPVGQTVRPGRARRVRARFSITVEHQRLRAAPPPARPAGSAPRARSGCSRPQPQRHPLAVGPVGQQRAVRPGAPARRRRQQRAGAPVPADGGVAAGRPGRRAGRSGARRGRACPESTGRTERPCDTRASSDGMHGSTEGERPAATRSVARAPSRPGEHAVGAGCDGGPRGAERSEHPDATPAGNAVEAGAATGPRWWQDR